MKSDAGLRNHLKSTRTRLGLSQQDLAQKAGVTRQTVSGIEAGLYAPSATIALRVARVLGCRVEDLFWLEEDLPTVPAFPAEGIPADREVRLAMARVGDQWVAHSLAGDAGFRTEMVPADGVGTWAAGEDRVQVRLVDAPEQLGRTVVLAGCTPALSLWSRSTERWHPGLRVHWTFANSMLALRGLCCGEVHAAGLHLYDAPSNEYNVPFVRAAAVGAPVVLVNLGVWDEGLVLRSGNPLGIRGVEDLSRPGVRLVNREPGAGARLLLEQALAESRIPQGAVQGWSTEAGSHLEVARAVASGRADAGVTTAAVAAAYDLEFLPLHEVRYDLALLRQYLDYEPVRQLLGTLDHRWVRSQLNVLVGYNTARTGEVVAEV